MSSGVRYDIRKDAAALAEVAAETIAAALRAAVAARGSATLVATGGSTPGPIYDILAAADLPWADITVTLSDERWVDPASPDSNEGMVRRRLLRGAAAAARFIPLMGRTGSPETDAIAASAALSDLPLPFDVVCLGMGDDGHIASLFPGNPALDAGLDEAGEALCIAVPADPARAPAQPRLTLTLPVLKSARTILLMFTGARKFDVLEAALHSPDPRRYPVRAILAAPAGVKVICAS